MFSAKVTFKRLTIEERVMTISLITPIKLLGQTMLISVRWERILRARTFRIVEIRWIGEASLAQPSQTPWVSLISVWEELWVKHIRNLEQEQPSILFDLWATIEEHKIWSLSRVWDQGLWVRMVIRKSAALITLDSCVRVLIRILQICRT